MPSKNPDVLIVDAPEGYEFEQYGHEEHLFLMSHTRGPRRRGDRNIAHVEDGPGPLFKTVRGRRGIGVVYRQAQRSR